MKRYIFTILLIACCAVTFAQQPGRPHGQHGLGPGQMPNFDKFLSDRISFVTKVMALSPEDSVKFVPIYKEKLKAKGELMFKFRPTTHIVPGQEYADSVYTNVAINEAQYKIEDARIDMEYLKKIQKILTPKQVFGYVQAEKMFIGTFMRGGGGPNGGPNRSGQNKKPVGPGNRRQ